MEPDLDAIMTSRKVLYVIFIILISVINLVLIVKQVRKPLFYQNAKRMIIFSLAIGDLLFALFAMVVNAELTYGSNPSSITWKTYLASETYLNYMIHFVYGIGLVTLGIEVFLRHRIYAINIHKVFIALFASSIPWILGLIIIVPLSFTLQEFMIVLSVFFPASIAVIVTVILSFVNRCTQYKNQFTTSNHSQVVYQPTPQQSSNHQQSNPPPGYEEAAKQSHVKGQAGNQYPSNQPGMNQYPSNKPGMNQYPSNKPGMNQYPSNKPGMNQYPSNQPAVDQYPGNPPEMCSFISNEQQTQTVNINIENGKTTNTTVISLSNRKKEFRSLLIIAIVFFLFVVPNGVFAMSITSVSTAIYVVREFLYWLMVLRSFLTPNIMLSYSDL